MDPRILGSLWVPAQAPRDPQNYDPGSARGTARRVPGSAPRSARGAPEDRPRSARGAPEERPETPRGAPHSSKLPRAASLPTRIS